MVVHKDQNRNAGQVFQFYVYLLCYVYLLFFLL